MSSSSNILKVLVGPHQPEKLLAVTTPITAIKAKLPAHLQEELPNLRASAWHTWTHTTAMGADKTQEEPTAYECPLLTVPSSRVAHWEQTSTKVLVSHLCLVQSSGVGERCFMREKSHASAESIRSGQGKQISSSEHKALNSWSSPSTRHWLRSTCLLSTDKHILTQI